MNQPDTSENWSQGRWISILDRIEHRQPEVGLRFWGPPLWLEVTMSGPDSALWFANSSATQEWNWQSDTPCSEAATLADEGADDDQLLAVVSRYAVENLILNSVHEIGEWFRFDGERVFPAHPTGHASIAEADDQGNGSIQLQVTFPRDADVSDEPLDPLTVDERMAQRLLEIAAGQRFTYFPDFNISFEACGPVVRTGQIGGSRTVWRSSWSRSTVEAGSADMDALVVLVARDVHRSLVFFEADRICRAFHVDGRRPWRLSVPKPPLGPEPADLEAAGTEWLALSIVYLDNTLKLRANFNDLTRQVNA